MRGGVKAWCNTQTHRNRKHAGFANTKGQNLILQHIIRMESQLLSYPGLQCDLSKIPWPGLRGLCSGLLTIFQLAIAKPTLQRPTLHNKISITILAIKRVNFMRTPHKKHIDIVLIEQV